MAILNGDWSVGGPAPGTAEDWALAGVSTGESVAEYQDTNPPGLWAGLGLIPGSVETWGVEYLPAFRTVDLVAAEFTQNDHEAPDDRVEDFEAGWPGYDPDLPDLGTVEAADFVDEVNGGTQPVEDFELVILDDLAAVVVAADFVDEVGGGTQPVEDFELVILDDLTGHLAAMMFDGPWPYEMFDMTTFWTDPDYQMETI